MECCVHSPCGRYLVKYKSDAESMCIDVIPKVSTFELSPSVHYVAVLQETQVLEITTAAGVRKEFAGFADMTYNAMIGRSPSVKFFVETCEEMKKRITAEVAQRGPSLSDITCDDSDASLLSESSRTQRFFSLDYDVDFTRAVFPVPLIQRTTVEVNGVVESMRMAAPAPSHRHRTELRGDALKNTEANNNNKNDDSSKVVIAKLQAENEKLRRENEALSRLSREKMLEMQRLCEDFQQRVEGAQEVERLRKKLAGLRAKLQQTETERDDAHAAFVRLKQRVICSSPWPDGNRRSAILKRRSRFDTPSPAVRRSSSSRLLGDSPAPRGRTGGRQEPRITSRTRSLSNGTAMAKRRLWTDGCSSRCSSPSGSRCSSRGSCERLYRTPTVSSRLHQRDLSVRVPQRAVFR